MELSALILVVEKIRLVLWLLIGGSGKFTKKLPVIYPLK